MNVVDEVPKPSITKIGEKMKTNNTTQTTNNTWSQTKLWSMSVLAVITFFCCVYLIATNKTAFNIFAVAIGVGAIGGLVLGVKNLIESVYDEVIKNK